MTLSFSPGSLIAARGREWVVIETRDGGAMTVRPLGGLDQDTQLFVPSLEQDLKPARFPPPSAGRGGRTVEARLLRDVPGGYFREFIFFHKATKTLILADHHQHRT